MKFCIMKNVLEIQILFLNLYNMETQTELMTVYETEWELWVKAWKVEMPEWSKEKIIEVTRQEFEFIMTWKLSEAMKLARKKYNKAINEIIPMSDKFTLVNDKSRKIKYYPKNDESNNNT